MEVGRQGVTTVIQMRQDGMDGMAWESMGDVLTRAVS
jgi:hypothetical protein